MTRLALRLHLVCLAGLTGAACSLVNAPDDVVDPGNGGQGGSSSSSQGGQGGGMGECGNGEVEAGEQCDDAGVSASCDDDCTFAECGDGILNTTAGETCDDGGASANCDDDCTPVSCGDGNANPAAGEECDGMGESANCDPDCSAVECGDGYINATANETCEDGNANSGDGCSAACAAEGSCSQPLPIPLTAQGPGINGGSVTTTLSGLSLIAADTCDGQIVGDGPDRVFVFNVASLSNAIVRVTAAHDVAIRVTTSPCNNSTEVVENVVNADGCANQSSAQPDTEVLRYAALTAGSYYLHVDSVNASDEGTAQIDVTTFTGFTCQDIHQNAPNVPTGTWSIDPDGLGGSPSFISYCDMDTNGGGWTLAARFSNADAANWMQDNGDWWYDRIVAAGVTGSATDNADMLSPAFWRVPPTQFKISRTDNPDDGGLFVSSACLGGSSFRQFVTQFGDFRNGVIWGASSVAFTCPGQLGNNYLGTMGFAQTQCAAPEIGSTNSVSFWAAWGAGDGAVMMIGGGGNSCSRADHGLAITEANSANFIDAGTGEGDFGDDTFTAQDPGYALNLFVR